MQNTLLGIAIVLIVALAAALIGPHFVDWTRYRIDFEVEASRAIGAQVRIGGTIDARLLPAPILTLQDVEVARPGDQRSLRIGKLGIEFRLGNLLRGEWRAAEVRLDAPEIGIEIDSAGRLVSSLPPIGVGLETMSIERFQIVNGLATLRDSRKGSEIVLANLEFKGEVRSFAGPAKGEGAFDVDGTRYPFRLAVSRAGEEGKSRIHLNLDPQERPSSEFDATVWAEQGILHLDGTIDLARPVGASPDGIVEPWRLTTHIKGDSSRIEFEQIEFRYAPGDRAIRLRGGAVLALGREAQLRGQLHATQIDFDRMLALPEPARRHPLVAIKALADYFGQARLLPIPVNLDIEVQEAVLAGAALQRINSGIRIDAASWGIDVEFRAPGATQVGVHGRLAFTSGVAFSGALSIEARERRALLSWLNDRADPQAMATGPLHLHGNIDLSSETIAIKGLNADLDGMNVKGQLAYDWPRGNEPPRIEATLDAPELDFDRTAALAQDLLGNVAFEFPRKGRISVKISKALIAGMEARQTDIAMRLDGDGFDIDRFAIRDFGGAALSAKGRIDLRGPAPRGTLWLDLEARALDGISALVDKFTSNGTSELRNRFARLVPAKIGAKISVDADPNDPRNPLTIADVKVEGRAGGLRVDLQGRAGLNESAVGQSWWRLAESKTVLSGKLQAPESRVLFDLLGLQSVLVGDDRPATLSFTADGRFDREIVVDAQVLGGTTNIGGRGTVRFANGSPGAELTLKVADTNLRSPGGAGTMALPATFNAEIAIADGKLTVAGLTGIVADSHVEGRLEIRPDTASVNGVLEIAELNFPAVLAAAVGAPISAASARPWSEEPFDQGLIGHLNGRIELRLAHATLTSSLAAKKLKALVQARGGKLDIDEIEGALAGGRVTGYMRFDAGPSGMTARSSLSVDGADLAELIRGGPPPVSGRLKLNVDVEGAGRSPFALIGSLRGHGTFDVLDGAILRLDPRAFETVIRSVDQGLPIEATRIRQRADEGLDKGRISIPSASGQIAIDEGHARIARAAMPAKGAELIFGADVALADDVIDASFILVGPERTDAPGPSRPQIGVNLKGTIDSPERSLDVSALTQWLGLRAIDQQTKRLDALEAGHEDPPGSTAARAPSGSPAANIPASVNAVQRRTVRPPANAQQQRPRSASPERPPTQPLARSNTWLGSIFDR